MIGWERAAAFAAVVSVLIAVPGPSVLFVVSRGVTLGRRAAVSTALGNEAGLLVQVTLVAVGLGEVLARSFLLFSLLKFAGALYLGYLGVQTWRHRHRLMVPEEDGTAPARPRRVFRDGFVVGATNPKGLLIFGAVLPQFVDPGAGHVHLQLLLLGLVAVLIALISDAAWGLLAGTARGWFTASPRRLSWIGGASGAVMVGLGARLALTDRA
ncbi:LysE family translocator [Streptomyces sp. NPDC093085]|uniref:LysE family translocator n=1 Tax=Streptomyces sp. NPDC093085 TaxID=3155068 RepID=UPI0034379C5E